MDITIRKLEAFDRTDDFDCGNAALNDYLRRFAKKNHGHMVGTTYVAVLPAAEIIAYYTIANTNIPRAAIPQDLLKGLPKYQDMPAILLGRLAVHQRYHGKKLGELLISHCFRTCLHIAKLCGARYLLTDAVETAVTWYERFGFTRVHGSAAPDTTKMFLDLAVVRQSITLKKESSAE